MADTVRVQFSASIGALIKGVEDAKHAIESVKESTDKVVEGAKSILEVFGIAFSADKVKEMIASMAELGEQIERSSAILGISNREAQQLGFISKATGGNMEGLSLSLERLQLNLQRAQTGTGPAAAALQALGLRAKDLIGIPLTEQLGAIADKMGGFADGGNKTAIAMALLGRNGAQMIPVLDKGRAGIEELAAQGENAGAVLTNETVEALSKTQHNIVTLEASVTGLGATLVGAFSKSINEVLAELTAFVSGLSALIEAGNLADAAFVQLDAGLDEFKANLSNTAVLLKDFGTLNWSKIADDWRAGTAQLKDIAAQADARVADIVAESKRKVQEMLAAPAEGGTKKQAPSLDLDARGQAAAQASVFQTQIKLADEAYKQTQERLQSEVKLYQITHDQETQQLLAALEQRHAAELAALAGEAAIAGQSKVEYQKIMNERLLVDQKYAADRQKVMNQAKIADAKEWQSVLEPIKTAFDSQLKGLLAGTETFSQAMKNVFADLVLDVIKKLEEIIIKEAAIKLVELAGGGPLAALLPGFASGSWSVPGDMVAMVHKNEMIVPAGPAGAIRDGSASIGAPGTGGGGGSTVQFHFNGPVVGQQAWINQMVPQLARALQAHTQQNPSLA